MTDKSWGMLNAALFERMKPGMRIVYCARAELIDDAALLDALGNGTVAYYFTDVFKTEPPADDDPIVAHEKTIVTPHLGGSTGEASLVGARNAAQQIEAFLTRDEIINSVNVAPGDPTLAPWEKLAAKLAVSRTRSKRSDLWIALKSLTKGKSRSGTCVA